MRWPLLPALLLATALLGAAGPPSAPEGCILLEDFGGGAVGEFPAGWRPRRSAGHGVYSVQSEGGLRYLQAVSRGLGVHAGKEQAWDLGAYPVLAWSWRPRQFPLGADERRTATNDSALSAYLLVPYSRIRGPRAVKYVWSEKAPVGTRLESNWGLTRGRVLRSGGPPAEQWVEERVNVLEDYRAFFGPGTPGPGGIAVLTDADDTRSVARGDYARFRACRA